MDLLNDYASEDERDGSDNDETLNNKCQKEGAQSAAVKSSESIQREDSKTGAPVDSGPTIDGNEKEAGRTDRPMSSVPQRTSLFVRSAPAVSLMAGRARPSGSSNGKPEATTLQLYDAGSTKRGGGRVGSGSGGGESLVLYNNPTKAVMYQPSYGPALEDLDPSRAALVKGGIKSVTTVGVDEATFHEQRLNFQRDGKALAPIASMAAASSTAMALPGSQEVVRTTLGYTRKRLEEFVKKDEEVRKRPRPSKATATDDRLVYGSDDEAEHGVWAPPSAEERWELENALTDVQRLGVDGLAPEQLAEREYLKERDRQRGIQEEEKNDESSFERLIERKMRHLLPPRMDADAVPMEATTTFHHSEEFDYKGRSWMATPAGLAGAIAVAGSSAAAAQMDPDHHRCFVPKKCVHRFAGQDKGVHRIRLFPGTGHLILSAGLDGTCKVWSVEHKKLMRTYKGHSAAVRDVQFNHDGTKFVSAGFDRYLRMWSTETGAVLQTFTNRKVPYCIQFYPRDDNFFVVGCSDNKIVAYDATSGEITQEYTHHLAPVNAILFVEDHGTKMISSSDDKKVLVWEWDIGVPIKYISDPTMHAMPCLAMHPSQGYFCGQSLDNSIAVFQAGGRFAMQRKKKFTGHVVSGYACEIAFSPDGQFLVSGDGNGNLWFWDWKRHKILQKFKAHNAGPAAGCVWHPLDPSVVFTCGWDGFIKMWQ
jgi:pre-mRNA-processing factor 17